jgi:tetratricopeptide (TPR) repeat protein
MTPSDRDHSPERIAPTQFGAPAGPPNIAPPVQSAVHKPLFWAVVLAVTVLLILVVLWLPSQINQREVTGSVEPRSAQQDESAAFDSALSSANGAIESSNSGADIEAVLAKRQLAQRIADALQLRRAELETLAVERWAASDYEQVALNDDRARNYFEQRGFEAAATYWQKAIADANTLLGQVEALLKATVVEGYQALEAGDSDAAVKAFELALAIHPENAFAAMGLRRAKALPQVLTLLAAAENHERQDSLDQAAMLYRQALRLDPQAQGAKEGLLRSAQGMQDWEFRIALSTAQQALEAGEFATAKREFMNAEKIKTGEQAVKDGIAQADFGLQELELQRLRRSAEQAERREAWARVESDYRRVLELDSTLNFARDGLARAQRRLELDQSIEQLISRPERLYSEPVREQAAELLAEARRIQPAGESLQNQTTALRRAIERAGRKLTVTLVSDNSTSVMVYRVGRLGEFEKTQLQLTPGDYVVVGRCDGYRDARKTLSIRPDMDTVAPFDIRCTEKI